MAPAKFDDISKTAKDVLSDDYTAAGSNVTNFKSKTKTAFEGVGSLTGKESGKDGATLTTAVDFAWGDKVATPAKLTWKFPKPFGIAGVAFDKLEMDKGGKQKLEAVIDVEQLKSAGLKVDVKTDLNFSSLAGTSLGATYTGVNNALVKCELNADKVTKGAFTEAGAYSAEVSYAVGGGATAAVKHTPDSPLSVGVNYATGPAFCSLILQESFASKTFHSFYKVNGDLKVAGTYNLGGKKTDGQWAAGLAWNVCDGTAFKGKIAGTNSANMCLSTSIKQTLAKGLTMTASTNVPLSDDKAMTWGLQFSAE